MVFALAGITASTAAANGLGGATYYWHVNATNANSTSMWSATWSFTTTTTQAIVLSAAWNLKSLNIHPLDSSFSAIVGSPAEFILIKDIYGRTYIPQWGITDLDTQHTGMGYQFYSQMQDTIMVTGFRIDVSATPITLQQSWNIIAYLPDSEMDISAALGGISDQIVLVKNNAGYIYMPSLTINDIGNMEVGEGYLVYAIQSVTFTYPAVPAKQRLSGAAIMLKLPPPKHYEISMNTGNNATYIGKRIVMEGRTAPDSCEIGAFNERGNLVGAGSVIRGRCAFAVWGNDPQTKVKNGCAINEAISLKLWDGKREYPLDFIADNNTPSRYVANGIFTGNFVVPEGFLIRKYDLTKVFPNPFRDNVKIEFDIPTINGVSVHDIEIKVFDFRGSLVQTIAKGNYKAGHYDLSWNGSIGRNGLPGSEIFVIQMKAQNFEKRVKIIRMR